MNINRIKIKYISNNGTSHYYIPDLLISNKTLEEVKPKKLLALYDNPEKFNAAKEYCKQHGLKFRIITEKELNIK